MKYRRETETERDWNEDRNNIGQYLIVRERKIGRGREKRVGREKWETSVSDNRRNERKQ